MKYYSFIFILCSNSQTGSSKITTVKYAQLKREAVFWKKQDGRFYRGHKIDDNAISVPGCEWETTSMHIAAQTNIHDS